MNDDFARGDVALLKQHADLVSASCITPQVAAARGYRSITTKADLARLGFGRNQLRVPALLIIVAGKRRPVIRFRKEELELFLRDRTVRVPRATTGRK